ncbi:class I SAM-dependent methyltransferase [Amycolatopsis sp. NPDC059021]|uniref:class I SAM-dependent methyltransferase n=1 Tax=Amycolatopsis sp. NPDC059021 TaxID=3346704 RepID=UPI00367356AC
MAANRLPCPERVLATGRHRVRPDRRAAQELPFPGGDFDACVSHLAFMLMPDIDRVATELARVLVPGGRLALVLDNAPADQQMPQLGDRRTRDREGIDEILIPAGFAPVEWTTKTLDLGGSAEQVWASVSAIYNFLPLDPAVVKSLKRSFWGSPSSPDRGWRCLRSPDRRQSHPRRRLVTSAGGGRSLPCPCGISETEQPERWGVQGTGVSPRPRRSQKCFRGTASRSRRTLP